ncbi:DgyrCDS11517 [Dimorphilus gyrociliatus]|nr:DgyrCDS11517 [Dimorphilus gyrociliatus]
MTPGEIDQTVACFLTFTKLSKFKFTHTIKEMLFLLFLAGFIAFLAVFLFADADLLTLYYERFGLKADSLRGKVIWITGASSGIGEYTAYELSKVNCSLILSARRKSELERVASKCRTLGPVDVVVLPLDVTDATSQKNCFDKIIEQFGRIDVLYNNAGRSQQADALKTELKADHDIFDINFIYCISLAKIVLNHMKEIGSGQVAFTSSIAGKLGSPRQAMYCATKHALHGWVAATRFELGETDIILQLLCPGPVVSDIRKCSFTEVSGKEFGGEDPNAKKKMSTERCAKLMVVAVANKIGESWITKQPILLVTYIGQYIPVLFAW